LRTDSPEQIAFVENLPLPSPGLVHAGRAFAGPLRPAMRGLSTATSDEEQSAYVAKGSLVSFVAGVAHAARADVLDALLFAQLGADARFDRERDFDRWHRFHMIVMENVGWTVEALECAPPALERFTIGELGQSLVHASASGAERSLARSTLAAAQRGTPAVFDESSHSATAGCFHIGTCVQLGKRIETTLMCINFQTALRVVHLMNHAFDRRTTKLGTRIYRCALDLSAHAPVAQRIRANLADNIAVFIHELAL
jgi:hypothetical protein